jgi:predicted ABC-type exoprotein transport system permease subunit
VNAVSFLLVFFAYLVARANVAPSDRFGIYVRAALITILVGASATIYGLRLYYGAP